jgi:hypothetical protein
VCDAREGEANSILIYGHCRGFPSVLVPCDPIGSPTAAEVAGGRGRGPCWDGRFCSGVGEKRGVVPARQPK